MAKKLTKKDYIKMYEVMLTIRRFEERAAQLYGKGLIGGFCHLYIGQEAVVVGILMTINEKDTVVVFLARNLFVVVKSKNQAERNLVRTCFEKVDKYRETPV